jgi:mono/diheme cytochrome c family protein
MFATLARTAGFTLTAALLLAAGGGVLGPSMAKAQTPWVAPAPEKAKKSPMPNDKKTVEQGEKVANVNCVACHGAKGKGDGPAAVALNPKVGELGALEIPVHVARGAPIQISKVLHRPGLRCKVCLLLL